MLLGPARVHAHQHLGPVLRLGAALAGVQLDEAVVAVRLAAEQTEYLLALGLGRDVAQRVDPLGDHGRLAFSLGELDQAHGVGDVGLQLAQAIYAAGQAVALAHDLLRALGVVPEGGVLDEVVQLLEAGSGDVVVKDASGAGLRIAGSGRGGCQLRLPW